MRRVAAGVALRCVSARYAVQITCNQPAHSCRVQGRCWVEGEREGAGGDSRTFGAVPLALIQAGASPAGCSVQGLTADPAACWPCLQQQPRKRRVVLCVSLPPCQPAAVSDAAAPAALSVRPSTALPPLPQGRISYVCWPPSRAGAVPARLPPGRVIAMGSFAAGGAEDDDVW